MQDFCGVVLGGGSDGINGWLSHARNKGTNFVMRTLTMLALPAVPQVVALRWAGMYCFLCGFRRPLFSVAQDVFSFICSFSEDPRERKELPEAVFSELLLGALLAPMAFCNLRAPIRSMISITDASEQGGAAGEASHFDVGITQDGGDAEDQTNCRRAEIACDTRSFVRVCAVCSQRPALPSFEARAEEGGLVACPRGCGVLLCQLACWQSHLNQGCLFSNSPLIVAGVLLNFSAPQFEWSLARVGACCQPIPFHNTEPTAFNFPSSLTVLVERTFSTPPAARSGRSF